MIPIPKEKEDRLKQLIALWGLGLITDGGSEWVSVHSTDDNIVVRVYVFPEYVSIYRHLRLGRMQVTAGFKKYKDGRCKRWVVNDHWEDIP